MLISDAKQLRQFGRQVELPFELNLPSLGRLECQQVFRVLPGRRLTVLAKLNNQLVVAKFFFDPWSYRRRGKRDAKGIKTLMNKNIETAPLLYEGSAAISGVYVVIVNYLENVKSFRCLWDMPNQMQLNRIFVVLAQLHEKGIVHGDIHLDNFLISNEEVYVIDGSEIKDRKRALGFAQSFKNLAWFAIHLGPDKQTFLDMGLSVYLNARKWSQEKVAQFGTYYQKAKRKHHRACLKKIFRDCTDVIHKKMPNGVYRLRRNYDSLILRRCLIDLDSLFSLPEFVYLKRGNSATVGKIKLSEQVFVIKRNNIKTLWHAIKRAVQPTRAAKAWKNAHYMALLGILTPAPIAMMEKRRGFVRQQSYYVSTYQEGMTLRDYFSQNKSKQEDSKKVAIQLVNLLFTLYKEGLTHGDLKATNFLVDSNHNVSILDLEGIKSHWFLRNFYRRWRKDLKRFLLNWENSPSIQSHFKQLIQEKGMPL